MFNGDYLNESGNIAHEIINLFRADNGRHYIYALPQGLIGRDRDGKVTDILLVQNVGNNRLKVLARVKNITCCQHIAKKEKFTDEEVRKIVHDYAQECSVKYNGVFIGDIFANNRYNNQKDISSAYFTFDVEPEQYRRPPIDKPIYISTSDEDVKLSNTKFRQTEFYSLSDNADDFNTLRDMIDDVSLWEKEDNAPYVRSDSDFSSRRTFLTICRKEYDELVYSNMLAYYLENNPDMLNDFVHKVLGLPLDGPFSIKREYKHTDILIENRDCSIILENKIKSGVNGVSYNHSQLDKYIEAIRKGDETKNIPPRALENIYGFVLCPNYNQIKISDYTNSANERLMARYYKDTNVNGKENVITYLNLSEFFGIYDIKDPYFADFKKALELHSHNHDTQLEDLMLERFLAMTKR